MSAVNNDHIINKIKQKYGEKILNMETPYELLTITVDKDSIIEIASWLSNEEDLQFSFLTDLTGVHYPDQAGNELGVVYHLHSFKNNLRIRLKIFTGIENPEVKSMTRLYNSANWMERETYDFFGIDFKGHPDLRRILNMDEMNYFPLQKQYPLEDQQREDKEDMYFGR